MEVLLRLLLMNIAILSASLAYRGIASIASLSGRLITVHARDNLRIDRNVCNSYAV